MLLLTLPNKGEISALLTKKAGRPSKHNSPHHEENLSKKEVLAQAGLSTQNGARCALPRLLGAC